MGKIFSLSCKLLWLTWLVEVKAQVVSVSMQRKVCGLIHQALLRKKHVTGFTKAFQGGGIERYGLVHLSNHKSCDLIKYKHGMY